MKTDKIHVLKTRRIETLRKTQTEEIEEDSSNIERVYIITVSQWQLETVGECNNTMISTGL